MKKSQQDIEHRCGVSQPSFDVISEPVEDLLHPTDDGQQGEGRFDHHAFVPGVLLTKLEVIRDALSTAKAQVGERNGLSIELFDLIVELLVVCIHRQPFPGDHTSQVIDDPAQLDANRPASFVLVLATHLLGTASFSNRKDEFNGKAIHHREESRLFQQGVTPLMMRFQQPQQAGAVRQAAKQRIVIPLQPAIESPEMASLQREQNTNCHQFAWLEFSLRMFLHRWHPIIDKAKDVDDNVYCGHARASYGLITYSLAFS